VWSRNRDFQANLFRVDGASQNPLWHAVVSTGRYIYIWWCVCGYGYLPRVRVCARSVSHSLSLCSQKSSRVDHVIQFPKYPLLNNFFLSIESTFLGLSTQQRWESTFLGLSTQQRLQPQLYEDADLCRMLHSDIWEYFQGLIVLAWVWRYHRCSQCVANVLLMCC
jgi:hypothetical protein